MKIVAVSDTHSQYKESLLFLPEGDVLVIAGDLTARGRLADFNAGTKWLGRTKFEHKLLVAGNHDWCLFREEEKGIALQMLKDNNITYLKDSGVTIDGVVFYGSPWSPKYQEWAFYKVRQSQELKEVWDKIPHDTDVLITHTPPYMIHDYSEMHHEHAGCEVLARKLTTLPRLKAHFFGHMHEGYGNTGIHYNVSMMDRHYKVVNPPTVVDVESGANKLVKELGYE